MDNISFVLPFKYEKQRFSLFNKTISLIDNYYSNKKHTYKIELCIHEVDERPHLHNKTFNVPYKYLFTPYTGIFHRAWVLNSCVRKLARYKKLVLLDGDLILTDSWFKELEIKKGPSIAFGKLICLNEEGTETYLKTNKINETKIINRGIRTPNEIGAAAGVTVIPRQLFYTVHGIPENFGGSWGGEDNAFMLKLLAYECKLESFTSTIYHMYHTHRTKKVNSIRNHIKIMRKWKYKEWKYHTLISTRWGDPQYICLADKELLEDITEYGKTGKISSKSKKCIKVQINKKQKELSILSKKENRWKTKEEKLNMTKIKDKIKQLYKEIQELKSMYNKMD